MPKCFYHRIKLSFVYTILAVLTLFTNRLWAGEIYGYVKINDIGDEQLTGHSGAVVYLTGKGLNKKKYRKKTRSKTVKQIDKSFSPRVLAVTKGTKVSYKNDDPVFHNVWSLSKTKTFDLGSYKAPESKDVTFDRPGLVKTFCNIHPGMIGSVLVLKNDFHSTTDKKGKFRIKNIPEGTYVLRIWAEGATPIKKKVHIKKDQKKKVNLNVDRELRSESHTNKDGKTYKSY